MFSKGPRCSLQTFLCGLIHTVFGEIFKLCPDYKADMLRIPVDVRMEQTWFKFLRREKVSAQGPRKGL